MLMLSFMAAKVVSVDASALCVVQMLEGPLAGARLSESARPLFPPGASLPPRAGDKLWIVFRETSPPGDPHYLAAVDIGADIVVDSDRNVVLKSGTLGVARLTDTVASSSALVTWFAAVQAQIIAAGGADVGLAPTAIGAIDSASSVVKSG